jgi:hypothetical protein
LPGFCFLRDISANRISSHAFSNAMTKAGASTEAAASIAAFAHAPQNASAKIRFGARCHKFRKGYPVSMSKNIRGCVVTYRQSESGLFEMSLSRGSNVNNL